MKLLHIDSSILGLSSASRELSAAIVARWQDTLPGLQVTYRDLDADPLPHLSGRSLAQADPAESADAARTMQEFLDANVIVIGAPMYNFGIPSTLKAWIDRIAVAGKTFHYTPSGPQGLAGGKKLIVASSRGGFHQHDGADFQESYLRHLFGFLGIDDVEIVRAEGLGISPGSAARRWRPHTHRSVRRLRRQPEQTALVRRSARRRRRAVRLRASGATLRANGGSFALHIPVRPERGRAAPKSKAA